MRQRALESSVVSKNEKVTCWLPSHGRGEQGRKVESWAWNLIIFIERDFRNPEICSTAASKSNVPNPLFWQFSTRRRPCPLQKWPFQNLVSGQSMSLQIKAKVILVPCAGGPDSRGSMNLNFSPTRRAADSLQLAWCMQTIVANCGLITAITVFHFVPPCSKIFISIRGLQDLVLPSSHWVDSVDAKKKAAFDGLGESVPSSCSTCSPFEAIGPHFEGHMLGINKKREIQE